MPVVIAEAKKLGYHIDEMSIGGGSAGHCLAMLYAYRDAETSPVPVRMVFGAVGPSSFYPEDWGCYGLDKNTEESKEAAAVLIQEPKRTARFGVNTTLQRAILRLHLTILCKLFKRTQAL